jgi:Tfp pilus assembly PilM family ATPase
MTDSGGSSILSSLAADPSVQKLKGLMAGVRRQLSRQILLVDFSDGCAVVAQCRLRRNGTIDLMPIDITELPAEAVERGIPSEPDEMAALLRSVVDERKLVAQRVGGIMPAVGFTTMLLRLDAELSRQEALSQLGESGSGVQLPFPRNQADLALVDVTDPADRQAGRKQTMLLMAAQRSNTDKLVQTFQSAGLELQFIDSGLLAPLRLIESQTKSLGPKEQLLHLNLSPGFTTCTVVQRGGPQKLQRLAPVRPYPLVRRSEAEGDDYFPITPEDLLSLERELGKLIKDSTHTTSRITLGGTGSAHPGIDELMEEVLEIPVEVVRPLQHPLVGNFELTPGFNAQALERIVGMALRCAIAGEMQERRKGDGPHRDLPPQQSGGLQQNGRVILQDLKARIKSNIGK